MKAPSTDRHSDALLEILADRTRRAILANLQDTEETTVGKVATGLAENRERERLEIALHHLHLPKFDAAGLIDYDAETGTIQVNDASLDAIATLEDIAGGANREVPRVC